MGNLQSDSESLPAGIQQFLTEQFQRLSSSSASYLTLSQLLQARHPQDYPFSFKHLGIIYICDHDMDGVFSMRDLEMFVFWVQINMGSIQMYEFQEQLQAKTVTKMLQNLETKAKQNHLTTWFLNLLLQSHSHRTIENSLYITIDAIKTIYELFNVQIMTDMDIQEFFFLVKKSSEELGYKIQEVIENDQEQEYVTVKVCEQFIRAFFKGINKLLGAIGYQTQVS